MRVLILLSAGRVLVAVAAMLLACAPSWADTRLQATRLVVAAAAGEGSIVIVNDADRPALVQVWIDDGRADVAPEAMDTPLQVLQPLVRLAPNGSQPIRIRVAAAARLPADRESLYWLNVMEIPPARAATAGDLQATAATQDVLEMVVRSRLKVIHRPSGLAGSPAAAAAGLVWRAAAQGNGIAVYNPSPWLVNLAHAQVGGGHQLALGDGSIPPLSHRVFQSEKGEGDNATAGAVVGYHWIDELGAVAENSAVVQSPAR